MLTIIDPPFYAGEIVKAHVLDPQRFHVTLDVRGWKMRLEKRLLSWEALRHTSEILSAGDSLDVMIQTDENYDPISEREYLQRENITFGYWLTRRTFLENPWPDIQSKYPEGSVLEVEFIDYVNWYIARVRFPEGLLVEIRTNDVHWRKQPDFHRFRYFERGEIIRITIRYIKPFGNWVQVCAGDSPRHHLAEAGFTTPTQAFRHLTEAEQERIWRG